MIVLITPLVWKLYPAWWSPGESAGPAVVNLVVAGGVDFNMSEARLKLLGWCVVLVLAPPLMILGAKGREWLPVSPVPVEAMGEGKVLFFTADYCGACRSVKGTVSKLRGQGFPIRTVNVQSNPKLAEYFGISAIPCFVYVKDGQEVDRLTGAYPADRIRELIPN